MNSFPFPLRKDTFGYGTNLERARTYVPTEAGGWGGSILDLDSHYAADLAERAAILRRDPSRLETLPQAGPACWDALLFVLRELSDSHPAMVLTQHGDEYHWRNGLLGSEKRFRIGDDDLDPLGFLGGQIQDDIAVLDQREGALWLDAGLVTFAAGWSLGFDVGMRFAEIHGPVPRIHAAGIVDRAERFLLRLQPGEEWRRTNWSMTVGRRLDTSLETYDVWKPVTAGPEDLHLRVEVQHLIRLGHSGALLFLIRTYLASLPELSVVPAWCQRLASVLRELPDDMADYKGLQPFRAAAVRWLLSE